MRFANLKASVAGAVFALLALGCGSRSATITVVNDGSVALRFVELEVNSCGEINSHLGPSLKRGEAHTFELELCGEGGVLVVAARPDDRTLKLGNLYVESGAVMKARVSDAEITLL